MAHMPPPTPSASDLLPQPTPLRVLLEEDTVEQHRVIFCDEYERCLEHAVERHWRSWSCEACRYPLLALARSGHRVH